jgi:uncharacterized membrane protein HdeD (DUF308 family)
MEMHPLTFAKRSIGWSIAIAILMILAGIAGIAVPGMAGLAITTVFGWLLIFSAIMHLVYAFHARGTKAVLLEILLAIVYGWIGVYLLMHPLAGLVSLTLVLGIYLLIEGILEIVEGVRLRPHPGWGWILFDGVVSLILGAIVWRGWPFSSVWAIGTLVGISMLFSGITRLMLSFGARRMVTSIA